MTDSRMQFWSGIRQWLKNAGSRTKNGHAAGKLTEKKGVSAVSY